MLAKPYIPNQGVYVVLFPDEIVFQVKFLKMTLGMRDQLHQLVIQLGYSVGGYVQGVDLGVQAFYQLVEAFVCYSV